MRKKEYVVETNTITETQDIGDGVELDSSKQGQSSQCPKAGNAQAPENRSKDESIGIVTFTQRGGIELPKCIFLKERGEESVNQTHNI